MLAFSFQWIVTACIISCAISMRIHRPYDPQPPCAKIVDPKWPSAYKKYTSQSIEWKGRVASNWRNFGHICSTRGTESKCHRCEEFPCHSTLGKCNFQIQGATWSTLSKNAPVISDTPWAVGGSHRNDFEGPGTSHVCVILSGGDCLLPWQPIDYKSCRLRCWGHYSLPLPPPFSANDSVYQVQEHLPLQEPDPMLNRDRTVSWTTSVRVGNPQGSITLAAGVPGAPGFLDGSWDQARFNKPLAVAVDAQRNIYVADTGNHCIRMIRAADNTVVTIAGVPTQPGFQDSTGDNSLFDHPSGITLYYDWVPYRDQTNQHVSDASGSLVILVSDSANHKIRKIVRESPGDTSASFRVSTLAGRKGLSPQAGFSDGSPVESRFQYPLGIAASDEGIVYVADSGNHLVRQVAPDGEVYTLAGTLESAALAGDPSCPLPCMRGSPGLRDGNWTHAQFTFPQDVALAPDDTVLVADGHRVRRVARLTNSAIPSHEQVYTLTGQVHQGEMDGSQTEASFHSPGGIVVSPNGHVYVGDTLNCRVRRLASASLTAVPVTCDTRALDLVAPPGCQSYNEPVDGMDLMVSDARGFIHFNHRLQQDEELPSQFGHRIHRCQGVPPPEVGVRSSGETLGAKNGTGYEELRNVEDTGQYTIFRVRCPPGCASHPSPYPLVGSGPFLDRSTVCKAALHNGTISDAGGIITVQLVPGDDEYAGSVQNGVTSFSAVDDKEYQSRGFVVVPYPETEVHTDTIYGRPAAPLENACGFHDGDLPHSSALNAPRGLALFANASLTDSEYLIVADSDNHVIRRATAMCTQVCENGGTCVAPDTCTCATGWSGHDCTEPVCVPGVCNGIRNMCVGPDQCECLPGFTGFPDCRVPLCVQTCQNGGSCTSPDTCTCAEGWIDTNCTTPVCSMTCGNGGACVGPDTCECPAQWTGPDCRTPVCTQQCLNGGTCSAPDTCMCPPDWSGHDCGLPVCDQGFLQAEEPTASSIQARVTDASNKPWNGYEIPLSERNGSEWRQYVSCNFTAWCQETNGFDCFQVDRAASELLEPMTGIFWRNVTGLYHFPGTATEQLPNGCVRIELAINTPSAFQYESATSDANFTSYWRVQTPLPYNWDSWAQGPDTQGEFEQGTNGWRSAVQSTSDRMVAVVELRAIKQGHYVCANGGNCISPGTCECAPGWTGFDCRTPICDQGYFEPSQNQYECSIRSVTSWENEHYIHDHPNYYSRYMDHHLEEWNPETREQLEEERPHYWDGMGWPALHHHTDFYGNDTTEGWKRHGYWERVSGAQWTKGKCKVEFYRHCPSNPFKARDIRTLLTGSLVEDTEAAYRASVVHTNENTRATGRWFVDGGECVDQVMRGCRNNGTCVAPNQCECAPGWTGHDCTIPVCEQQCSRPNDEDLGYDNNGNRIRFRGRGNCTLPNTCTCEKGWSGPDCSVALCAQICGNDGRCTLPDTCTCARWESTFRDGRLDGGRPLFRTDTGNPQFTGWTGYDCATPICTQAKQFVHNNPLGDTQLGGYGLILFGHEPYTNTLSNRNFPPYEPFEWSADIPPIEIYIPQLREYNKAIWDQNSANMLESAYRLCRMKGRESCMLNPNQSPLLSSWNKGDGEVTKNNGRSFQFGCKIESERFSDDGLGFLCNVIDWFQGDYDDGRTIRFSADATSFIPSDNNNWEIDYTIYAGEGIYECYNQGSCVAPDVCSCPYGYEGFDCRIPLCRHKQVTGELYFGCMNNGVCVSKDTCQCEQYESTLYLTYPETPRVMTGWNGTDCSIAMCAQGTFDPECEGISLGGEGCFRCKNGGYCTAPDFCSCPPGWTGHDCGTPVCSVRVDERTVMQLDTGDVQKIQAFELDPCQNSKTLEWEGRSYGQGNCTGPGLCTCLCQDHSFVEDGEWVNLPWQDPLERDLPLGFTFGTMKCRQGYEGIVSNESFHSCHLEIYIPTWWEEYSRTLIGLASFLFIVLLITYLTIRRRLRQKYLLEKAARRRSVIDQDFDDKFS